MNWTYTISEVFQNFWEHHFKRDDGIGKFDPRSDKGMFLGYSLKEKIIDALIKELRLLSSVKI